VIENIARYSEKGDRRWTRHSRATEQIAFHDHFADVFADRRADFRCCSWGTSSGASSRIRDHARGVDPDLAVVSLTLTR